MTKLKIKPLGERVLLEATSVEETGGIVLPEDVETDKEVIEMKVVDVGPDLEAVKVKKGDRVLLRKSSGAKFEIDGRKYRIVRYKDLLAAIS